MENTENQVEQNKPAVTGQDDEGWGEIIKTVLYALVIAVIFRSFLFQPFVIPSESMLKNLEIGDYLMVSKYSYGFSHHSLPFSPKIFSGRIFDSPVERGDVVVFRLPRDPNTYYIKRAVGLPGDTVQMKRSQLYINGELVPRKKTGLINHIDDDGRPKRYTQYEETLPNGKKYLTLDEGHVVGTSDDTPVYKVPEGHYFMMGDNRDNSVDSRVAKAMGVGYVPAENIIGRAEWITLSFDNHSKLWEFWKWFPKERREKFFSSIN